MDKRKPRHTTDGHDASTIMRSRVSYGEPAEIPVRIEVGAVIAGRLHIGPLLGQGGMGNVYAARDHLRREDVAIKVLRDDLSFSSLARERFLAEARLSCNLSHPNIVRVFDVGVSGTNYYLSMERLQGRTLRQLMEAQPEGFRHFPLEEVTNIAGQLIEALRYAHRYIVHRDVKPENVWLCDDGTVKLMDFGIARAYTTSDLTRTGVALGTAYYMAPEQRGHSKEVDWRADQYSVGVILYELLTGTVPIGAFAPLQRERRDIPKRYARAVMRTMAPRPENRFPSLAALLAELKVPKRRFQVSKIATTLIAANVLAIVAFGAWLVFERGMKPEDAAAQGAAALAGAAADAAPLDTAAATAAPLATDAFATTVLPVEKRESPPVETVARNPALPLATTTSRPPVTAPKETGTAPKTEEIVVPQIKAVSSSSSVAPSSSAAPSSSLRAESQLAMVPSDMRPYFASILSGMVAIPAGQFRMGDVSGGGDADEAPVHTVRVPAFQLSKYEVTTDQYAEFLRRSGKGEQDADLKVERTPVVSVSWDEAQGFIEWLNQASGLKFRLPSEAEWEYAARAGAATAYYWGPTFDSTRANGRGVGRRDQWERLAPVGSFAANAFGLFDMSGNVWEWTQDCYESNYATAPTDGRPWSTNGCERRVMRGGGWFADASQLRSADRDGGLPTVQLNDLGLRLALD
jgi:formylglycine-generating enzyme required for sulfatase activity